MEYLLYWLFFELIGCSIARVVIPALSFGRVYVHSPSLAPEHFNWLGCRRDDAGRVVIARDVAGFVGFMVLVVVFLAIIFGAQNARTYGIPMPSSDVLDVVPSKPVAPAAAPWDLADRFGHWSGLGGVPGDRRLCAAPG